MIFIASAVLIADYAGRDAPASVRVRRGLDRGHAPRARAAPGHLRGTDGSWLFHCSVFHAFAALTAPSLAGVLRPAEMPVCPTNLPLLHDHDPHAGTNMFVVGRREVWSSSRSWTSRAPRRPRSRALPPPNCRPWRWVCCPCFPTRSPCSIFGPSILLALFVRNALLLSRFCAVDSIVQLLERRLRWPPLERTQNLLCLPVLLATAAAASAHQPRLPVHQLQTLHPNRLRQALLLPRKPPLQPVRPLLALARIASWRWT